MGLNAYTKAIKIGVVLVLCHTQSVGRAQYPMGRCKEENGGLLRQVEYF